MTIELLIDTVDKTADIVADSLVKEDIINEQKDTLRFRVLKYGTTGFVPAINQEVELNVDAVKEFAGVILEVNKSIQSGLNFSIRFIFHCLFHFFICFSLVMAQEISLCFS